ncbi:MAG TPA: nitric-oxide reductase large subunit [Acidobacteriota bacterium]|nr:nitric-oxide reductase large subunit [Acidobacteriota bacterium]
MNNKKLWITLGCVVAISFAVLGGVGYKTISEAPPIPIRVVSVDGQEVIAPGEIQRGQAVWQSLGGQSIGSIFGHGANVAPDWSADWLHREAEYILNRWSQEANGTDYASLSAEQQAAFRERLKQELRTNTYDPVKQQITVSRVRAEAFTVLSQHYKGIFASGKNAYAIPPGALTDATRGREMSTFFWWTSWVCATNRPGEAITYTNNWPHEPLIGNVPTASAVMWSIFSVILLLAGIGALVWYMGSEKKESESNEIPLRDPLLGMNVTPSQRATMKYFIIVTALIVVQVIMGAITAHYGVEGNGFYGIPLAKYLPYSVARIWHLQIGLFWIATSWLATGLFVAPAIGGSEPKGQKLGVDILFGALIFVVGGSLVGELLSVHQKLGDLWFWFGTQGYEYVDLGRFWQVALLGGMVFWLWLVWRAIKPGLLAAKESKSLLTLFVIASIAIPLFYSAGLMYGKHSHIVRAEYWRWWVVHLWVEGFFEVFATVVIAFLFTRLQLLSMKTATKAVLFSTIIYLTGGIIGTFHHLYFTGTPTMVLALGATFSALEIVPLVLVGFEAWENLRLSKAAEWLAAYRWVIYFFVGVAFWNLVGAGLFGFLINPPVALYYMQGLNLTPVHGHTALFGVYGMLGIGLMLFCLRAYQPEKVWHTKSLAVAFWSINLGLVLMVVLSLLPIGLLQTWAAIEQGTWYARSAEFLQTGLMDKLRWLRVIGDTLFSVGVFALGWFVFRYFVDRPSAQLVEDPSRRPHLPVGQAQPNTGD